MRFCRPTGNKVRQSIGRGREPEWIDAALAGHWWVVL